MTLLLEIHFRNEAPGTFLSLTDMPLVHGWDPGKIWALAIGSLDQLGGAAGSGGAFGRGGGGARPRAHLGPCGGRSWGGGVAGEGARRCPAVAAAAGCGSGERGATSGNA
jgi:hypothetical protein